jgi:uncharacterized membrane protein YgdD (TMEM256/DUF423 family)
MSKLQITGLLGAFGVMIGAFGAHGIKPHIAESAYQNYQTGVLYHFIHTLALLGTTLLMIHFPESKRLKWAFRAFIAGILLFSGSLYLLSTRDITGIGALRWLGPITPLGGLAFIVGWGILILSIPTPAKPGNAD